MNRRVKLKKGSSLKEFQIIMGKWGGKVRERGLMINLMGKRSKAQWRRCP
jgi:hypothetical protein